MKIFSVPKDKDGNSWEKTDGPIFDGKKPLLSILKTLVKEHEEKKFFLIVFTEEEENIFEEMLTKLIGPPNPDGLTSLLNDFVVKFIPGFNPTKTCAIFVNETSRSLWEEGDKKTSFSLAVKFDFR